MTLCAVSRMIPVSSGTAVTVSAPGPACAVRGAGCAVPRRARRVARPARAGPSPPPPASSPATRASRAARSERQIVVLLIQGLRERFERFRLTAAAVGRHFGRGLGARELARFATPAPAPAGPLGASPGRQQDHFPRDDLGDVARLLLPIFPRPVFDAALDVDPIALLHVLLGQVRQLGALVVPADHAMPLRLLLLLAPLPRPLPTRRQ